MKSFALYLVFVGVVLAGSSSGRSQPIVSIPDNCVFLTNTQTSTGGQYSYIDPVGSLITITYEFNGNGDYTESRKVILDYASGHTGSGAQHSNVNTIIGQVIREIEIQITTTIQEVLSTTNVNAPNFQARNLVQLIVQRLRPLITSTVQRIISQSGLTLSVDEVTQNVVVQIQPAVLEGIEAAIKGSSSITIGVNRPGFKPAGALSGQGEISSMIIDQIISQLRPIIVQIVNKQTKIQCQNHSSGSSSGSTSSFGTSSGSSSTSGFVSTSSSYGSPSGSQSSSGFTSSKRPSSTSRPSRPSRPSSGFSRPTSTSSTSSFGSSSGYSSSSSSFGSKRPSTNTRPSKPITTQNSVSISQLTDELVEIIVESLKDDIQIAVLAEIRAHSENDFEILADSILTTLRPAIIKVIRTTVNGNSKFAGFKSDIESLTTRILNKLRPIILRSIQIGFQKVSEEEAKQAQVAPAKLIDAIIAKIRGQLADLVKAELLGYSGSLSNLNKQSLINTILQRLRPIILSTLKDLQRSDARFASISSSTFDSLVDQIVEQLRPLIIQFIEDALSIAQLEEQLIQAVIRQIEGQIEEQVDIEINGYSGNLNRLNKQKLADTIAKGLRPTILSALKNLQQSDSRFRSISVSQFDSLVAKIIDGLRPIIFRYVELALKTINAEEEFISFTLSQVRGQVEIEVNAELQRYTNSFNGINKQSLLNAVIQRLRPIILSTLEDLKRSNSRFSGISSSKFNVYVSQVIDRLRPFILQLIDSGIQTFGQQDSLIDELLSIAVSQLDGEIQNLVIAELRSLRNLNSANEQQILQIIIKKLIPIIRQTIQRIIRNDSRFAVLSSQIDIIIDRIIEALRSVILDAIRFNIEVLRKESIKVVTQPPRKKENKITQLFGIEGENNVKVETPKYNYQYAIDFNQKK